ncbi:hypothetical protein Zmor_008381 [Zophobas morio]|uniref:Uncharacterized protein n=1 Tax=Zophobas morio TaxID=2755281 RepID=A0AA38MQQ9_9CUCU|nr:hypothetical protein Zmor_008381 [Zophobas morio]
MGKKMSKETYFELINNTSRDITGTSISQVEDHDWIGDFRPDKNLQGRQVLRRGGSIRERQQLCGYAAHCPFTMMLEFSDGTKDGFRVHQMYAVSNCCDQVFHHFKQSHDIDYKRVGDNTLRVTIENTQDQLVDEKAEQVNTVGEEAMRRRMYELAVRKFKAAKTLAKEKSTINKIETNLKRAEKVNQASKLNEEGKELMRQGHYESAIRKFDAALKVADRLISEDIVSNRKKAVNARAEKINNEGEEAMRRKSYNDAMEKFDEALTIADEPSTRTKIMENKNALRVILYRQKQNERAVEANRAGEEAFEKGEYETAIQKFKQAYRLSNEMSTVDLAKTNLVKATNIHKAQQKNEEANQLLKEKEYETALKKINEALELAEGHSLVSTIENNKLRALKLYGKASYNEAWNLENNEEDDMSKEAEERFKKAENIFKLTNSEDDLRLVKLKMAGNRLFNRGVILEHDATNLHQKAKRTHMVDDYVSAQRKYEETLKQYEKAKQKFREGASNDEMFSSNVNYVGRQIDAVRRIVQEIEEEKLSGLVREVMFNRKKSGREDVVDNTSTEVNLVADGS